ncbi:MAG: Na+/H+ antiporter NhaC family protein [Candidatus Marinimicrobia bacterium]|nr:Na+/H+ antiporter NhaC family protein [Candidatus Neomarinimicrobiota bacterium]MBT3825315.1 Na+/H+ antiporter NhaC family protein [Candidatus Neomarinimicrobiota bacterium]MBT4129467.1 Na+/H+ antiporter NhaC family protein [Candidatus Neomarinimicrobiota bacterium]MBT4295750.1 Na+/H+ antiporter NhaC family protein [Candidatus Neomarinimicrobiota bacterium]MBT4419086.1 Na+/H+ antiporter NhaC family protein [Candidatus Neomarinimicrobiota bacterium]
MLFIVASVFLCYGKPVLAQNIHLPTIILSNVPFELNWEGFSQASPENPVVIKGLSTEFFSITSPVGSAEVKIKGNTVLEYPLNQGGLERTDVTSIPGWLSLLPPLLAIVLALLTKEMLISLFAGIWVGVTIMMSFNPINGFLKSLDGYIVNNLADPGHATILLFTFGFGGLIGIVQRNGGLAGIVAIAARFAKTRVRGQVATAAMGLFIFFDDYANSLLVGNTMRPFTDKLRVSREKLSYIVDSTAAPVASIGIISTWIVFAMSLLDGQLQILGIHTNAYLIFLLSIPFSYYAVLAIIFVFMNALSNREFGPMYAAEKRAITTGQILRPGSHPLSDDSMLRNAMPEGIPHRWYNAVIPILIVIVMTMVGMIITGMPEVFPKNQSLMQKLLLIMDNTNSSQALLWGSYIATFIAITMALGQKLLTLKAALESWFEGARTMFLAVIILILAWSLGSVCTDIHTADFIVHYTRDWISPGLLPTLTFIMAGLISFATGTSYGTMSILIPLIVPLSVQLTGDVHNVMFWATFSAIISGATFGDHCSPISDTTILSSLASGADNVDHVQTQLPYALVVGGVAILFGFLPIGLIPDAGYLTGVMFYALSITALFLILKFYGKSLPLEPSEPTGVETL